MDPVITRIGGEAAVRALVERFYDLVERDPRGAQILALHFRGHGMGHVRAEQFDFLSGFFGGRRYYLEKHGHMNLREIHAHVPIRAEDAEDWLYCMGLALDEIGVGEPVRGQVWGALARAARVLVNRGAGETS